jgi:predicted PurR-regulated permease PerM
MSKTNPENVEITISNRTVFRIIATVIAAGLLVAAVQKAAHALVLIFTALFLALALNAPVHWIAEHLPGKRRGNRTLGTAISFLLVVVFMAGFLASIVPPLVRQTNSFIHTAPNLVNDLRSDDTSLGHFVRRYNLESQTDKISKQLSDRVGNLGNGALGTFTKITSSIFATLTVLVITFMMLIEGPHWLEFGQQFVPKSQRPRAKRLAHDMYRVIKGYVNGQVFLAALASVLILVPLLIFGVSYPIALMVIVFICGLIPMVGHTIGAVIVSTVALFQSPVTALIILAYYILYQQIENYVVQPKIQANSTDMPPLMVFISVLIGISFGGLLGGLVAIPVAGCIRIALLDYLEMHGIISKASLRAETTPGK